MKFKRLNWGKSDHMFGVVPTEYYVARAPFGLTLDIRLIKGRYYWDLGTEYFTLNKGSCTTLDKAKKNCERAYHKYVEDNVARCVEQEVTE